MSSVGQLPDILKMIRGADLTYEYSAVAAATLVVTVPAGSTYIVFLVSGTNGTRVSTMGLAINDGAAKTLRTGVAEGDNLIEIMPYVLKAGWTMTLTDEAFVGGDAVTKVIAFWNVAQT